MKNQYFLKDKKAELYRQVTAKDTSGKYPTTKKFMVAELAAPLWCYAKQTSQSLYNAASILDLTAEDRFFVFNNNAALAQRRFILYRGEWYEIDRGDRQDDYNGDMFVYANIAKLGDRPSADEVKPYGWKPEDDGYISN